MNPDPRLEDYAIQTYEKLRFADTDQQGHVNSSVASTMIETGRVEVLYDPANPMYGQDCTFVLASQTINYHTEIMWPGLVEIGARVARIGKSSVAFEYALFQNKKCVATASAVVVQISEATRHSVPLNADSIARLEKLGGGAGS